MEAVIFSVWKMKGKSIMNNRDSVKGALNNLSWFSSKCLLQACRF